MSRFINLAFFVLLSASIYTTFSIKDEVAILAKKVAVMKKNIHNEQEKIEIYTAELSMLTGAAQISMLKDKLIPNLKIISVDQIQFLDDIQPTSQLAQNLAIAADPQF